MPPPLVSTLRRSRALIAALVAITLSCPTHPAAAQTVATDLPLPSGGSERVLFAGPANPRAILVMLPGSDGVVVIGNAAPTGRLRGNFLVRTLSLWTARGFAIVLLDAPQHESLLGRRHTPAYAMAIEQAVDFARSRLTAPVWLIGTSMGTISAVNGARLGGKVAGVALNSSVTRANVARETVFDADPAAITVPTLIVANRGDTCPITPPVDAATLAAYLSRSPRKEVMLVDSTQIQEPLCEGLSPHGFLGIEPMVVERITGWITGGAAR
jgi:pimeloyl-ACP methyl ester carboxylesterase